MNYREMESELFANGCYIEYECITSDDKKIRIIKTLDNTEYRLIYIRNEHRVFVVNEIIKLHRKEV